MNIQRQTLIEPDIPGIILTASKRRSDRLLVYFSSAGAKGIQGVSKLSPYDTNIIFVRDGSEKGWYNSPIKGLSANADDLAEKLSHRISGYDLQNVTVSGSSMGGYAALLFGIMLKVGRIVAIGPQILLRPELTHCPKSFAKYDDLTSLVTAKSDTTQIDIWYGAESYLDLFNVLHIKPTPTVRLHAVSGAMHNVLAPLKRQGQIDAYFEYITTGKPFTCKTISPTHASEIIRAGVAFYFEADNLKAIELLKPIADEAGLSAVYFLIGHAYFRMGDLTSSRIFLERAAAACHENFDANYQLGLVLEKKGKHRAAADAFLRGLEYFPSPNGARLAKLASAQYKSGQVDDAIRNHKTALSLDKRQTKSHFELGKMLKAKGAKDEALHHFQEHAKANPNFTPTQKFISSLRANPDRNTPAVSKDYFQVLSTDPKKI